MDAINSNPLNTRANSRLLLRGIRLRVADSRKMSVHQLGGEWEANNTSNKNNLLRSITGASDL